jgi:hypothetical protein
MVRIQEFFDDGENVLCLNVDVSGFHVVTKKVSPPFAREVPFV